ncbi:MAG: hypothetical protein DRN37_08930 [Thermoplasmata archaeon]|nr:MAG: hypothetical protein DRN37_08930 [Thermoplasmata archaeon]
MHLKVLVVIVQFLSEEGDGQRRRGLTVFLFSTTYWIKEQVLTKTWNLGRGREKSYGKVGTA